MIPESIKFDIFGYLLVLGAELTHEEHQIAVANLKGCFVRLIDYLEKNQPNGLLLKIIRKREQYNVCLLYDPLLAEATIDTIIALRDFLKNTPASEHLKNDILEDFLAKFDVEI